MEQTFRTPIEHNTGVMITENGVEQEIVTLDPLYLESEPDMAYGVRNTDFVNMVTALSNDTFYSDYHVITLAELLAIKNFCCEYVESYTESMVSPKAILSWKSPENFPNGMTGVEWAKQTLGIQFDGVKGISTDADGNEVITEVKTGTNQFWIANSLASTPGKIMACSEASGIWDGTIWGPGVATPMRGILLVKNRS